MKPITDDEVRELLADPNSGYRTSNGATTDRVPAWVRPGPYSGVLEHQSIFQNPWNETYGDQKGALYLLVRYTAQHRDGGEPQELVNRVRLTDDLLEQRSVGMPLNIIVQDPTLTDSGNTIPKHASVVRALEAESNDAVSNEQTIRDQYKEELIANGTNRLAAVKEAKETDIAEIKEALGIA